MRQLLLSILLLLLPIGGCLTDPEYLAVNTLDVAPSVVAAGGTATVSVDYSAETDSDVAISWSAEDGVLLGSGDEVEWIAPTEPGFYTISVTLSADDLRAVGHRTVQVVPDPAMAPLLELTVLDATGEPLVGAEVKLQLEILGAGFPLAKASTVIEFSLEEPCEATLDILDLEGRHVRRLAEGAFPAGVHGIIFDGSDTFGNILRGTRVLAYELVATSGGQELFRDRKWMTLHDFDLDRIPVLGATDATGRVTADDPTLFPFLYALPILHGRDETQAETGEFTISSRIRLLVDIGEGEYRSFRHDMDAGPNRVTIRLVDGEKVAAPTVGPRMGEMRDPVVPVDPPGFGLSQNYPNPFN